MHSLIPFEGKFADLYLEAWSLNVLTSITRYMSLIAFASITYQSPDEPGKTKWSQSFRRMMLDIRPTSHEIVMLLTLLSGAMQDGRALPPYLPRPDPYALSERLEAIDSTILSVRHVNEPGYAAFAVLQLAARCCGNDIDQLIENVKALVGELDFSIHTNEGYGVRVSSDVMDDDGEKAKED
jgi:hypothetical protein